MRASRLALLMISFCAALNFAEYSGAAQGTGRAEPLPSASILRSDFVEALRNLQVLGVRKVAGRDITQLLSASESVLIEFQEKVRWQGPDGSVRTSARWKKPSPATEGAPLGVITASRELLQAETPLRAPLANHEHFGPLGIEDDNANVSALIQVYLSLEEWSKTRPQEVFLPSFVRQMMREQIESGEVLVALGGGGGGVTGVEGGGLLYLEYFMMLVQKELFQRVNGDWITPTEYKRVLRYIKTLDIQVSDQVPLWQPRFDAKTKTVRLPRHELRPEDLSTFDFNQQVTGLVNAWLDAMYGEKLERNCIEIPGSDSQGELRVFCPIESPEAPSSSNR